MAMDAHGALAAPAFLAAAMLAGLMGFSIQQGNTCLVAAVHELVEHRRVRRLQAMIEAGIWVGGILAIATLAGAFGNPPMPHGIGWLTVVGGILLGAGASVNGACVFGSVARLGSGQVAYLATPAGILAAALAMAAIERRVPGMSLAVRPAPEAVPAFAPAVPALVPLGLLLLLLGWRLAGLARTGHGRPWPDRIRRGLRSPHGATTMIGVCFALLLLFAGPWSYPEVLADLARERLTAGTAQGVALFLILLAGAFLAGRMPRHGFEWPGRGQPLRCFAGGFIMALGASLVPGSNDSLLLLGVPMLWPFAILALLAMGVTIAGLQLAGVRR